MLRKIQSNETHYPGEHDLFQFHCYISVWRDRVVNIKKFWYSLLCLILLFYALKKMWMICFDVLLCLFDVKRNSHCNIYWNFVLVKLLLAYGSILVLQIACLSLSLKIKVIYLWCDKIIKLKFFVWFIHSSKNGH